MSALNSQKDLIATFKREVLLNTSILSKVHPIDHDLSRHIFKEDALEKPTQHIFIHLSYYLVSIIDSQRSKLITWPLFDTRAEKNYRNELSRFVAEYHQLGLLAPVMSSYFVNPGCFRVVKLLFQLSHLAVQNTLKGRLLKESQVSLYEDITNKYKSKKEDFVPIIEKETAKVLNSFSKFMEKKRMIEDTIIVSFHQKIMENEKKLALLKETIDGLFDNFIKAKRLSPQNLEVMLTLKDNKNEEQIFDIWLEQTDHIISVMEKSWDERFTKVVKLAENCQSTSQTLIARQTGDADRKLYSIEYNHKTDEIQTRALEATVSVQQKYILKNLVIKDKLQFPTLIRAYLISISHLLNGVDLTDDLDGFNMAMECERKNYEQVISALKALIDRVEYAEGRLLPRQLLCFNSSINIKELTDIPPLPDLTDLKTTRDLPFQSAFESFTPLTLSKHQFNLRKRYANSRAIFVAPQPRLFVTPSHAPREDFIKTIQSCKIGILDKNRTQNLSFMSEAAKRINETIADCNTGFTKQQIQRLLSTKKGSTTKKNKFNLDRPKINIKKGGLFNDTTDTSFARSHSSPDLYANKKNKRQKVLSVMQEDIPALLEVSGISIIRNNSECNTPNNEMISVESSRTHFDVPNLPTVTISPVQYLDNNCGDNLLKTNNLDDNIVPPTPPEVEFTKNKPKSSKIPIIEHKTIKDDVKTPQATSRPSRKSTSIEKIINRFKKVKASVLNDTNNDLSNCSIIREEKENFNAVNINLFHTKKVILPDLLSPNYGVKDRSSEHKAEKDSFEELCLGFEEKGSRKPRPSLGTALGVDQTFLDQFELID